MRVVSIGDLVTDYYYKDGKLLGVNGGMTSHNIIANLSNMGIETSVFGVCGNDKAGMISIKSLEDLKVDIMFLLDVFMYLTLIQIIDLSLFQKKDVPFVTIRNGMIILL